MTASQATSGKAIESLTTAQAAHVSGLSTHMVNYLCRIGVVVPTATPNRGRGRARRFTFGDVVFLRVMAKLLHHGISVSRLTKGLKALYAGGGVSRAIGMSAYLVTDGRTLFFRNRDLIEIIETKQLAFAFVLELADLRAEVSQRFRRLVA